MSVDPAYTFCCQGRKPSSSSSFSGMAENEVLLRGLPSRATEDDVRAFFKGEVDIVGVKFAEDRDGRIEAAVQLGSAEDTKKAAGFHRQNMGLREVEVRMAGGRGDDDRRGDRDRDRDRDRRDRRSRSRDRDRDRDRRDRRSRSRDRDRDRDRERRDRDGSPVPERRKRKGPSNWDAPAPVGQAGEATDAAINPQLTFKARRIYVGNLPQTEPPVTDAQVREFFDQAMHAANLTTSPGCCVSDVWISQEKHFAFVEVRSIQEATNSMNLDGVTFYGQPIRVNRPHDYVPPNDPIAGISAMGSVPGAPSLVPGMPNMNNVNSMGTLMALTKKCRRIHVGNLPMNTGLTPAALKVFISQLMQQLALVVKPGDPVVDSFLSQDGKFGFIEFRTIQEANNALAMSGVEFMGRNIRVGRPSDYMQPSEELLKKCEGTGILGLPGDQGVSAVNPLVAAAQAAGAQGPDLTKATNVVVIKHMMSAQELADDQECKEIAEDTVDKCQSDFGGVAGLIIARPGRPGLDAALEGKTFVQFETEEGAKKAAQGLWHVKFDDRIVETEFADQAVFDQLKALYPEQTQPATGA